MNQRLPSGPAVIPNGSLSPVMPALYSVTAPAGVIFPILLPLISVNQRLPSGPAVILEGQLPALMPALYSVTTPAGVIFPILLPSTLREPEVAVRAGGDPGGGRCGR